MTELEKFLKKNDSCQAGCEWALSTGATSCAEIWARSDLRLEWRVWMATRPGVLDHKTLVRFAVFCARQIWDKLKDERSKNAILIIEKWLAGEATLAEVKVAAYAAYAAAGAADAARAAYAADAAAYAADAARAARAARAAQNGRLTQMVREATGWDI